MSEKISLEIEKKPQKKEKSLTQIRLENLLSRGFIDEAFGEISLAKKRGRKLNFRTPEFQSAFQKGLECGLLNYDYRDKIYKVINFAKKEGINLNIQSAVEKGLETELALKEAHGIIGMTFNELGADEIITFAKKEKIETAVIQPILQKALENEISKNHLNNAREIITLAKKHGIEINIQPSLQKKLEDYLSDGLIVNAREIISFAKKDEAELDIRSALKIGIESCLFKGWAKGAANNITFAKEQGIDISQDLLKQIKVMTEKQKGLKYTLEDFDKARDRFKHLATTEKIDKYYLAEEEKKVMEIEQYLKEKKMLPKTEE